MRKNRFILFFVSLCLLGSFYSCEGDDYAEVQDQSESSKPENIVVEELPDLTRQDLLSLQDRLENAGFDLSEVKIDNDTTGKRLVADIFLKVVKVTCKTDHPDGSGRKITVSGVMLVPRQNVVTNLFTYQLVVVPPPTYTANGQSPSNLFKKGINLINIDLKNGLNVNANMFAAFAIQAASGYAVLIPDYPGFGDSYKECTIPYLESKPIVNSTIDLVKAAYLTLSSKGYRYNHKLAITGYSQGGYVAASLARELETNPKHGLKVSMLITGGTPCNLKQIIDIVRASDKTQHTFFIPYAVWAYKQNGYPNINVSEIFKEPYASKLGKVFNGANTDPNSEFPNKVSDLYTQKFLTDLDIDPAMAYMNDILDKNSVHPWRNSCRFVMTHGISDVSVYYQNAKDFSVKQNQQGGRVTFCNTVGDHLTAIAPYYLKTTMYLSGALK